jgi:glycosyltransferase involved in cell wall biosynthesis
MIRVGFWFDYGLVYAGGLNYFRNLLLAIREVRPPDLQAVLFIGNDLPAALEGEFRAVAEVVKLDLLTRGTVPWFFHRLLYRSLRCQLLVARVLEKHRIDIVSHASMVEKLGGKFKLVSWIADFQYLHLPQLFPGMDFDRRSAEIIDIHRHSDAVILSSQDALRDFASIVKEEAPQRTHVLPFVSQPSASSHDVALSAVLDRYGLPGRYFLLPNQFWAHKNHRTAFEAVARLRRDGIEPTLVCTGWMNDPRKTSSTAAEALSLVEREGLKDSVRLLGSIDYAEVLALMRGSVAVINPSLFEGWSSSVEEAKSMGKPVIISDIPVHREQAHPQAHYFNPHDPGALARLMKTAWESWPADIRQEHEAAAREALHRRTLDFGRRYVEIVRDVAARRRTPA